MKIFFTIITALIVPLLCAFTIAVHGPVDPHQAYLYYGGPEFESGIATTTALYKTTGTIAAVRGTYTSGRYILFGVHPEVLSDSGIVSTDPGRTWFNREFVWARNGSTQPVLVYVQTGETWSVSVSGIEAYLTDQSISYTEVDAAWVNTHSISTSSYSAIFAPGGLGVGASLDATGATNIATFVASGGAYVGICSGAFAACATEIWEGDTYFGIGFFNGTCTGAIDAIAAWPDRALERIYYVN